MFSKNHQSMQLNNLKEFSAIAINLSIYHPINLSIIISIYHCYQPSSKSIYLIIIYIKTMTLLLTVLFLLHDKVNNFRNLLVFIWRYFLNTLFENENKNLTPKVGPPSIIYIPCLFLGPPLQLKDINSSVEILKTFTLIGNNSYMRPF